MMVAASLNREERVGLVLAVVAHVALVALIMVRPATPPFVAPPERIAVTLSDEIGLKSTSPQPMAEAAPDIAPELGEPAEPTPPQPQVQPQVKPEPPKPEVARPVPRPAARTAPASRPVPKAVPSPAPRPSVKPAQRPPAVAGGSRIGSDFLKGVTGATTRGTSPTPPADNAGPEVKAALKAAISRKIKPHWRGKVPEGVDTDKLVTILSWNLNPDGSLAGTPVVVSQEGITDSNRPQAARHAEQAVRAVQLAAPFELPAEFYGSWKRVASFRFDKRLSQ